MELSIMYFSVYRLENRMGEAAVDQFWQGMIHLGLVGPWRDLKPAIIGEQHVFHVNCNYTLKYIL
jgi:hypothetical protein